jgi:hypothetical protein
MPVHPALEIYHVDEARYTGPGCRDGYGPGLVEVSYMASWASALVVVVVVSHDGILTGINSVRADIQFDLEPKQYQMYLGLVSSIPRMNIITLHD